MLGFREQSPLKKVKRVMAKPFIFLVFISLVAAFRFCVFRACNDPMASELSDGLRGDENFKRVRRRNEEHRETGMSESPGDRDLSHAWTDS